MEAKPSLARARARAFFIDGKTETEAVEKADLYISHLAMNIEATVAKAFIPLEPDGIPNCSAACRQHSRPLSHPG